MPYRVRGLAGAWYGVENVRGVPEGNVVYSTRFGNVGMFTPFGKT